MRASAAYKEAIELLNAITESKNGIHFMQYMSIVDFIESLYKTKNVAGEINKMMFFEKGELEEYIIQETKSISQYINKEDIDVSVKIEGPHTFYKNGKIQIETKGTVLIRIERLNEELDDTRSEKVQKLIEKLESRLGYEVSVEYP